MINIKLIMEYVILDLILMVVMILLNKNIYFLNFLINLEYFSSIILFYLILIDCNSWIFMIYLIYSVCEGVLGLSLLVSMSYESGHQKISVMNLV
nr:TPA_asm: ND4L [Bombus impatiens]